MKGYKLVWTKGTWSDNFGWVGAGWSPRPLEEQDKPVNKGSGYFREDFEEPEHPSEMDLIRQVQNEVQFGPVGLEIDKLPPSLRDLMQSPDSFHISRSNQLFKVVDPITQVLEHAEWGSDSDDADPEVLEEKVTTTRAWLEQSGIVSTEAPSEAVTDILGDAEAAEHGSKEIASLSPYTRVDVEPDRISVTPQGYNLTSEEPEEDAFGSVSEEEVIQFKDPRMVNTALPEVPSGILKEIQAIKEEFGELIGKAKQSKANASDEEKEKIDKDIELLSLIYEQTIDSKVNPYLTTPLNSPFCGRGYSTPRRRHDFIPISRPSPIAMAAEERVKFFYALFGEAAACSTNNDLFGPFKQTPLGQSNRPGGFYGKIRGMNSHDKELSNAWSLRDKTDKDGVVTKSAFSIARNKFIQKWRDEGKDEEGLRIALWAWFDRTACEKEVTFTTEDGRRVTDKKRYKDSIWRQKRTQALTKLFLTIQQWNAIYTMLKIVRRRIKPDDKFIQERKETLELLRQHFVRVENLQDLYSYCGWAQRRKFLSEWRQVSCRVNAFGREYPVERRMPTYKFLQSHIDKLTPVDEMNWRISCQKKRKYLEQRFFLFSTMNEQITSIVPTSLEERAIPCYDPKCECMAIGEPQFATLEGDRGQLFVRCTGCGKPVWLINHKDPVDIKSKDELIKLREEEPNGSKDDNQE